MKLSQQAFANVMGVSKKSVEAWEMLVVNRNNTIINNELIVRILEVGFGIISRKKASNVK